jgi:hypothetical protein
MLPHATSSDEVVSFDHSAERQSDDEEPSA